MTEFRDHSPITINEFNGLWARGDSDSCPQDHFSDCLNIQFIQGGFQWRDGLDPYLPFPDVVRLYTFTKQTGQSLIILNSSGEFIDSEFPSVVILTVSGATDFGFYQTAGRCYISPCDGETGLAGEFIYVYLGAGDPARKAAGLHPLDAEGMLTATNSATAGNVEAGVHVFACVYETDTGYLTKIGPQTLPTVTADGTKKVDLSAIPVSPQSYVVRVHLLATKAINPDFYNGDTRAYQFFFIPEAVVTNGTTTLTVNFFDSELLEDASYLLDMIQELPATAGLGSYHNRMVAWASNSDPSLIRVSVAGEPEAFSAVDGLVIFPLDGRPVTNVQEFRDVMYAFKLTKTNAWTDNGDVPSSWAMTILDQGIGAGLHSIGKVLDSEGVNVDFLVIGSLTGLYLFNGAYQDPELSWKIRDYWLAIDKTDFEKVQILNDSIEKKTYIVLPDGTMLFYDYSNGLDPKNVRFSPFLFDINVTAIALNNGNNLIIASDGLRV